MLQFIEMKQSNLFLSQPKTDRLNNQQEINYEDLAVITAMSEYLNLCIKLTLELESYKLYGQVQVDGIYLFIKGLNNRVGIWNESSMDKTLKFCTSLLSKTCTWDVRLIFTESKSCTNDSKVHIKDLPQIVDWQIHDSN